MDGAEANVNGHQGLICKPVAAAGMVCIPDDFLEEGADSDELVATATRIRNLQERFSRVVANAPRGGAVHETFRRLFAAETRGRALHEAVSRGDVSTARALLARSRTDPNAIETTHSRGCTPLMTTCLSERACVTLVRMLLDAGADATLTDRFGLTALHIVALRGRTDLVGMLYSASPAMLNNCTKAGETPLYLACVHDHESMVSKLLSFQRTARAPPDDGRLTPLLRAVVAGLLGVVRVLIIEGGITGVGGFGVFAEALQMAVCLRRPRILRLLLHVHGHERRWMWAHGQFDHGPLLHYAASYCCPAAASILLEAGADEAALDCKGRMAHECIGEELIRGDLPKMNPMEKVAIGRMLQRGPGYRARSWGWPIDEFTHAGVCSDAGAGYTGCGGLFVSSLPPAEPAPRLSVRVFRPEGKIGLKPFVQVFGRYCNKD